MGVGPPGALAPCLVVASPFLAEASLYVPEAPDSFGVDDCDFGVAGVTVAWPAGSAIGAMAVEEPVLVVTGAAFSWLVDPIVEAIAIGEFGVFLNRVSLCSSSVGK